MQNQNHQTHYQPVNCWKCKTQNNIARNSLCRHCGSVLRSYGESSNIHSFSFSDHPIFKWMIAFAVLMVLFMAGMIYLQNNTGGDYLRSGTTSAEGADISLPVNSWYNESLWSYVSANPSVSQILNKNREVSGKEIYPDITGTLEISGSISGVKMPGFGALCYKEIPVDTGNPEKQETINVASGCEDHFQNPYQKLGGMQVIAKKPDKVLRIISSKTSGREEKKVIEGFSENGAWRKTTTSTSRVGMSKTKIEDLSPAEILLAQKQTETLWRESYKNLTDAEFVGVKKVNENVAFLINRKKDGETQTLYFDSVTGYLIKIDLAEMSVFLNEYKDYQGTQLPSIFYYRISENDKEYLWLKVENLNWKFGEFVDDSIFEKPAR